MSCFFEILDLYIVAVFGFWITLMLLAYVSLRASISVLVSLFAPLSSLCIALYILHSSYLVYVIWIAFCIFILSTWNKVIIIIIYIVFQAFWILPWPLFCQYVVCILQPFLFTVFELPLPLQISDILGLGYLSVCWMYR